jgi:membrane associated rhomboid family serine protease
VERLIRLSASRARADAWGLALSSQSIASRSTRVAEGWGILVDADVADRASAVLEAYDRENLPDERAERPPEEYVRSAIPVAVALLLVLFFFLTGPRESGGVWFREGAASAQAILRGEVWRTVTALTLHADLPHVAGNALFFSVFATGVCWSLGPGVSALLILAAGAGGNGLNALLHPGGHVSVGASTAVFGAVGILSGIRFGRRGAGRRARRRGWLALAAGLALLAMLGVSERADVTAHLLGLVAGVAVGWPAGAALARPPGAAAQMLCLLAAGATVLTAWLRALA